MYLSDVVHDYSMGDDTRKKEKKFLNEDFERFEIDCLNRLKKFAKFYDKFRVIYGKSKHGLGFVCAGLSPATGKCFEGSVLQCFGRISKEDKRPKASVILSSFGTTPAMNYKFFDFVSIIKFDKNLIDEINSMISDLKGLASFITSNHQTYALNRGKAYLPNSQRNGKRHLLTSREIQTEDEENIVRSIGEKNLEAMYLPKVNHIINNVYNSKIIESMSNESVTNIRIPVRKNIAQGEETAYQKKL
jgi:hypothetical protein